MEPIALFGLIAALGLAFAFEFVNGFHDTANAVATVIYTRTLPPWIAVVWSGLWNLTGVLISSGAVAFGIIALLPVELIIHVGSAAGYAMVFALLTAAIIWNLGTWYVGLPASSSHTLIGSIIGVGIANSLIASHVFGDGVNWGKVQDTGMALLISPLIGFALSAVLLLAAKLTIRFPALYKEPPAGQAPPWPVRALLVLTCTGVSFAHGSNDGQKGMGLIMLILIGVLPGAYALNGALGAHDIQSLTDSGKAVSRIISKYEQLADARGAQLASTNAADVAAVNAPAIQTAENTLSDYIKVNGKLQPPVFGALASANALVVTALDGKNSLDQLTEADKKAVRNDAYLVSTSLDKLAKGKLIADGADKKTIGDYRKKLDGMTKFIPAWVKVAVALCLGLGTMVGWKRIVVTVGERIGKAHLTYGQGASAEIVAYGTIQLADVFGLPVSTTHVLSSGIAGTMAANGSGLQAGTLRNILLAWVLTLPVCVFLGSALFSAAIFVIIQTGGAR